MKAGLLQKKTQKTLLKYHIALSNTHQQIRKRWYSTLYLKKKSKYKNRQDLNTDKDEMLESVFIEVLSKSNKTK